jgi:threonine dehydrogenase-like Zn-dependent dehydrogenase
VEVDKLVTHSFPLEKLLEALVVAREKRGNPLKVMVTM